MVICLGVSGKSIREYILSCRYLEFISKGSKYVTAQSTANHHFQPPHCHLMLSRKKTPKTFLITITDVSFLMMMMMIRQNLKLLETRVLKLQKVAGSIGLSSFKLGWMDRHAADSYSSISKNNALSKTDSIYFQFCKTQNRSEKRQELMILASRTI